LWFGLSGLEDFWGAEGLDRFLEVRGSGFAYYGRCGPVIPLDVGH